MERRDKLVEFKTTKEIYNGYVDVKGKKISVLAVEQHPVFQSPDGKRRNGRNKVSIQFVRGEKIFSFSLPEAEEILKLMGRAIPQAAPVHSKLEQEFRAWRMKKDAQKYRPGGGRDARSTGKTERKKKAGKAGADYHRRKKAERTQRDRQIARDMGAGKKKA